MDQVRTRNAPGLLVALAFLATMLGTTLPTPLYPIYQQELGFGGLMVTVVFATYAVGVLAALLLFGRLSDRIGRRPVLLPGLALAAASSLVFLIPDSLPALFAGRVLSGLSAGVFTGVATATIVDLAPPEGRARAGLLAAAVNMLGLGLGPVVAGALADLAPLPLVLPYLVHLGMVAVGVVAVLLVPEPVTRQPGPVRLEVQRLSVPADVRPVFVRAGIAGFAGFAVLGFFTAVSPLFVSGVLREPSHLLSGLVVFSLLGSSTAGQLLSARLPLRTSLLGGLPGAGRRDRRRRGRPGRLLARRPRRGGGGGRAGAGRELPRRAAVGHRDGAGRAAQRGLVELLPAALRRDLDPRHRGRRGRPGVRAGPHRRRVRRAGRAPRARGVRQPAAAGMRVVMDLADHDRGADADARTPSAEPVRRCGAAGTPC
ncbi:MAG: MFS transporter [Pseudonocardiales bacterium]|nr:MFS transporter [Pseudonocardiales bacterium]